MNNFPSHRRKSIENPNDALVRPTNLIQIPDSDELLCFSVFFTFATLLLEISLSDPKAVFEWHSPGLKLSNTPNIILNASHDSLTVCGPGVV